MSKRDIVQKFPEQVDSVRLPPNLKRVKYDAPPPPIRTTSSPSITPMIKSAESSLVSSLSSRATTSNFRGSSLTDLTNSNFFEKRLLWADSNYWSKVTVEERVAFDVAQDPNDNKVSPYLLTLPKEMQHEFQFDMFSKNLWVIRAVHIIMILIIIYGIVRGETRDTPTSITIIRAIFIFVFVVAFALSFLKKAIYKDYYHALMLVGVTLYTPTIIFEFYQFNPPFIIFFSVLVFCGLYATGCLLLVRVLVTYAINILIIVIVLFAVKAESVPIVFVYWLYLLMVFIVGAGFLRFLEKSRKQNFVFSSRLQKQSSKLLQEKGKSEKLLMNILPDSVAKNLKKKKQLGTIVSEKHPDVTILVADIVGFTEISSTTPPKEIVSLLNELFSSFDDLCNLYGVEKIKTIGDAYVAVAGLTYNPDHAQAVVDMALEMLQAKVLTTNSLGVRLRLRIGIASGPVIAGVIGIHKWCYDLYGDTVTEAAYMESHSAPSRILVANSTYEKLPKDHYKFEERVPVNADESQHLGKSQFVVSRSKSGTLNPFGSDASTSGSPRVEEVEEEFFEEKSKLNKYTLRFAEDRLEKIYAQYLFGSSLVYTRFHISLGFALHLIFSFMDMIVNFDSLHKTWPLYYILGLLIFVAVFALTFWKSVFQKVFEPASLFLSFVFGIITIAELSMSSSSVSYYVHIRTCVVFLYIVGFYPLGFVSVISSISLLFIALNIAGLVDSQMKNSIFTSDYFGLIMLVLLIFFSKYRMEREVRKTFVLKRRVRYKGVVITHEQKKSEQLLLNILPAPIAQKLKEDSETYIADSYKEASCMFIKVLGLEEHTKTLAPNEMMGILNTVFSEFDRITSALKLEKIKTIGTTYMVVGGVPIPSENHLWDIADMALRVRRLVAGYKSSPYPLDVQIGINIGPCVAGIIGIKRISFDLWGDAINTASRMSTFGLPGHIQVTETAAMKLKGHYLLQERGKIAVKGKGMMTTYWLTGQKSPLQAVQSIANLLAEEGCENDQPLKEESDLTKQVQQQSRD